MDASQLAPHVQYDARRHGSEKPFPQGLDLLGGPRRFGVRVGSVTPTKSTGEPVVETLLNGSGKLLGEGPFGANAEDKKGRTRSLVHHVYHQNVAKMHTGAGI